MLENIISQIKSQVMDQVESHPDVPQEKKGETIEATTESIVSGLKQYIKPSNISAITSLFKGKVSEMDVKSSTVAKNLESGVISSLTSKVGLQQNVAQSIASSVIPALIAMFTSKTREGSSDFSVGSLISGFMGKNSASSSSGGGLKNFVGGLFGGKK